MQNKKTVCVVGLGYVGLPLAMRALERDYSVIGFDLDKKKNKLINQGRCPIEEDFLKSYFKNYKLKATDDPREIKKADIVLICVPTPVDEKFYPDLRPERNSPRF